MKTVIGPVDVANEEAIEEAPRSPGMKYTHYAPEAPLFIIEADLDKIEQAVTTLQQQNKKWLSLDLMNLKCPMQTGILQLVQVTTMKKWRQIYIKHLDNVMLQLPILFLQLRPICLVLALRL